jgi:N-methylhydantoinase B
MAGGLNPFSSGQVLNPRQPTFNTPNGVSIPFSSGQVLNARPVQSGKPFLGLITVTAPLGTVMNAVHPAAVNGRTSTCQRAADLVIGALAQAAPERCIAAGNGSCATASFAGVDPRDGHLWVYLETIAGGSGARVDKDGLDGVHVHMTSNLPVEALEIEYPLTVLRYELVEGSGGAGRFRGGMGLRRVYRAEAECQLRLNGSRLLTPLGD